MKRRTNINYTLEVLENGHLNIYRGTTCTYETLCWQDISVRGAMEALSVWIIPWVEAVMKDSTDNE